MKSLLTGGAAALLAGLTMSVQAATPESGTLTLHSGPIEFSEGPNVSVNPTPAVPPVTCVGPVVLDCDFFALTIDLPENTGEVFPSALIRMTFSWDDPAGAGAEDYDIYLYDADGNEVNRAATAAMPEVLVQLAEGGVTEYSFEIVYFTTFGSTYTGRIELDLGEPSEQADVDEFFEQNSVLGSALKPRSEQNEPRNAYVERRSAGGGLGAGLLLLLAGGLAARRRG